jgi:hypothetical protein
MTESHPRSHGLSQLSLFDGAAEELPAAAAEVPPRATRTGASFAVDPSENVVLEASRPAPARPRFSCRATSIC